MEVGDEEEGGIFDGVDEVVVASMEMKEEEDDLGDPQGVGGCCCSDGDEEELMKARVLVKVKASLEK